MGLRDDGYLEMILQLGNAIFSSATPASVTFWDTSRATPEKWSGAYAGLVKLKQRTNRLQHLSSNNLFGLCHISISRRDLP